MEIFLIKYNASCTQILNILLLLLFIIYYYITIIVREPRAGYFQECQSQA